MNEDKFKKIIDLLNEEIINSLKFEVLNILDDEYSDNESFCEYVKKSMESTSEGWGNYTYEFLESISLNNFDYSIIESEADSVIKHALEEEYYHKQQESSIFECIGSLTRDKELASKYLNEIVDTLEERNCENN